MCAGRGGGNDARVLCGSLQGSHALTKGYGLQGLPAKWLQRPWLWRASRRGGLRCCDIGLIVCGGKGVQHSASNKGRA